MFDITEKTFNQEVKDGLVLVDFWAVWCGPCRMLTPVLQQLENELDGKLKIVKINADEEPELVRDFGVKSIPTMILFKDGVTVRTIVGVKPKQYLMEELEYYL